MSLNGKLYVYCTWIWKFAYSNLLWWLFTIMGLVVFGITPATISLYTITRKWLRGDIDIPIWETFWKTYKSEFFKSNIIGLIYIVIGLVFSADVRFMFHHPGAMNKVIVIAILILAFIYMVSMMYLFPVYVHYNLKPLSYIKYSFMIGINQFPYTVIMIAVVWASYMILKHLPGVTLFFGASILSFGLMWAGLKAFNRIEVKAAEIQGVEIEE